MKHRGPLAVISTLVLAVIVLSACGGTAVPPTTSQQDTERQATYSTITPVELKAMLEHKDFVLVNVHVPYEGEIPGTDLFAPYSEIERYASELPQDRGAKVVLYCRYGPMSIYAANTLASMGFTNILVLEGGLAEWERQIEGIDRGGSPEGQARISFDQESVDLGKVPAGAAQSYTFTLRNTGDRLLELRDVRVEARDGC
jgi:rhodanese-related sulfurtransferase